MERIYWSLSSSIITGGDGVKGVDGEYHYFSPLQVVIIRERENLV